MQETQAMQEEMRERIRAALAGESGQARAVAVKAVEDEREFLGGEDGPIGINDDVMDVVFDEASFSFLLWLTDELLDERPGMTDEEIDALPNMHTRADQWGIAIDEDEATEAATAYWREDLGITDWFGWFTWGA